MFVLLRFGKLILGVREGVWCGDFVRSNFAIEGRKVLRKGLHSSVLVLVVPIAID